MHMCRAQRRVLGSPEEGVRSLETLETLDTGLVLYLELYGWPVNPSNSFVFTTDSTEMTVMHVSMSGFWYVAGSLSLHPKGCYLLPCLSQGCPSVHSQPCHLYFILCSQSSGERPVGFGKNWCWWWKEGKCVSVMYLFSLSFPLSSVLSSLSMWLEVLTELGETRSYICWLIIKECFSFVTL